MRRLVVVSNRVAGPDCQVAGGLAVCVLDGLRERGGMWFGWNGETVPDASEIGVACSRCGNAIFVTVPITEEDYQEYYLGYCNGALWPVFHYRLDLARFTQENSEAYRRVNERFERRLHRFSHQTTWSGRMITISSRLLRACGSAAPAIGSAFSFIFRSLRPMFSLQCPSTNG
jgi:trehalose-6-phosphate synthase